MTALKDTNFSHCNKSDIFLAELMENATISTTKNQHSLISVVLMPNAAQRLGVDQVALTQH